MTTRKSTTPSRQKKSSKTVSPSRGQDSSAVRAGRTSGYSSTTSSARMRGFLGQYNGYGSWRQFIPMIRLLVQYHEEARAYVHDIVDLGGATGHYVEVRASSDRTIQRAEQRLNEFALRVNADRGGLAYAVNNSFREMAITGALSLEGWAASDLSCVQDIAHIRREELYTEYDRALGRHLFYQRPVGVTYASEKGILMPLDTFHHGLFEGQGDTADPVPPLLAILDALEQNQQSYKSLTKILQTFGLYGAIIGKVDRPDPTQFDDLYNDPAYDAEVRKRIEHMKDVLKDGQEDAMYVFAVDPENMKEDLIKVQSVSASGAQNADQIAKQIKDRISTGSSIPGFLHGNPEGISDAYMRVIYPRVLDHIGRYRQVVGGAFEKIIALDMMLGGIPVKSVTWNWKAQKNGYEDRDANARRLDMQADLIAYQTFGDVIVPQLAAKHNISAEEMLKSIKQSFYERQLDMQQQQIDNAKDLGDRAADAADAAAAAKPSGDTPTAQGETSTDKPRQDRPAKTARFEFDGHRNKFVYVPDRLVL